MKQNQIVKLLTLLLVIGLMKGCATDPNYATQFRFPTSMGNIEEGKKAFVDLGCNQCHTVKDVSLPDYKGDRPLVPQLWRFLASCPTLQSQT